MATVAKVVGRALRLIQVIDARQPVRASDMETAIEALNAMIRRWEADGISLGWMPNDNPSEEVLVPDEAVQAVAANLEHRRRRLHRDGHGDGAGYTRPPRPSLRP